MSMLSTSFVRVCVRVTVLPMTADRISFFAFSFDVTYRIEFWQFQMLDSVKSNTYEREINYSTRFIYLILFNYQILVMIIYTVFCKQYIQIEQIIYIEQTTTFIIHLVVIIIISNKHASRLYFACIAVYESFLFLHSFIFFFFF